MSTWSSTSTSSTRFNMVYHENPCMTASFSTQLSCLSPLPAPTHFIVVRVPRQESGYSYMYVCARDIPSVSTIILLDGVTIQTVWYFLFFILFHQQLPPNCVLRNTHSLTHSLTH